MASPVSLYIHIPFCAKKCLFCSFAVAIAQTHRADQHLDAIDCEAAACEGRMVSTVYVGGGTPSMLTPPQLERLVDIVRRRFQIVPAAEWTIEANPDGVDKEKAGVLKSLGFTRLSLGVQSFQDTHLKFLGRTHDAATAAKAFGFLRQAGFDNLNIDLMYGFPGQSRAELAADLRTVASLQSEHVSIYTLTVEPNSRFYAQHMKLDSDEKLAEDYCLVTASLEEAGCRQYEVSNFARPGFESRHNQVYWQGGDYIGLGMGAHSLAGTVRSWNISTLSGYLDQVSKTGQGREAHEELTPLTRLLERVIFGLRMNAGIDLDILEKEAKVKLPPEQCRLVHDLMQEGLLQRENSILKTTLAGRLLLDELSSRLL